jgi:broad specificity phosphatase PhoE
VIYLLFRTTYISLIDFLQYGTEQWDAHWSLLTGDGTLTWGPDPHLTKVGEGQAHEACSIWKSLVKNSDAPPLPTAFFSSPLIRSAKTLELSFEGLQIKDMKKPKILECLRENFQDRHTCDQRSSKSIIAKEWDPKGWIVDENMDEEDTLFASNYRETTETMTARVKDALSLIFDMAPNDEVINITSHSGTMQALCRAVNHDDFKVKTGGMLPMLIKATEI